MKYLFVNIGIRQAEFSFNSLSVHKVESEINSEEFGTKYAQNFYSDFDAEEDDSENGEDWHDTLLTFLNKAKEISLQDYQVLKRFL